jgi:hypothetical protein
LVDRQEGGMTLSRRGFMAAAPAAAIVAPAVAAKIVQDMAGSKITGSGYGYAGMAVNEAKVAYVEGAENWAEQEIKSLISNRARVKDEYSTLGHSIRFVEAQRIDGLRSVSPVSKARMVAEAERRRECASELRWLDQRIAEMKKNHPVLAYLTEALT